MGALQVEVKILKKAPLLFAWENKHSHQVESYLITCPCQQLGLQGATEDDGEDGSIFQGGDEVWAAKLAYALEISEVVSLSSIEPCVSIGYGKELADGMEEADNDNGRERRKKVKKSSKKKKKTLHGWENGLCEKDVVSLHEEKGSHVVDSDVVAQEQTVETTEAEGEQGQSESHSSMQEDLSTPGECSEGQTNPEGSNINNENSTVDDTEDSSSNEEVTNSKTVGADLNNASKESENSTCSDSNHEDGSSNVVVHTEDVSTSRSEEHSSGTLHRSQIIPRALQLSGSDGAETVISKDQTTIVHVASTSNVSVPVSEEEALMNAISSIMEIYPGAVVDVPQEITPAGGAIVQMTPKKDKPDFIRTLTEGERRNMFKFHKDIFEDKLKKLEEGGNFFLCEHCGKIVSSGRRKQHMQIHSELPRTRDFTCDQCGKAFFDKGGLAHHMISHSSAPQYKCRYCSKTYKSLFGRTIHERAHFNIYAGVCNRCGSKFQNTRRYKAHMARDCTTRSKRRDTGRKRTKQSTLNKDDPNTSTCNICGKVLRTASMPAHIDMHAGKMYTCPVCNKSVNFTTRYVHMKIHNVERNFVCAVCNKSFKTNGVLTTHMMIHTGERPLKCRYCDKRFSRYTSRTVHETIHTGERPFPCTICNKGWKDRPTYMAHMKKHHPGAPVYYKLKSSMMNQQMLLQSESTEKQDN